MNETYTTPLQKQKIAVLGGGLSSLTAVYKLTTEPDWQQKYDITVYQMGWRLGGKGASGINEQEGHRIEEHGLHLWMGFYENAFRVMKECYAALQQPGNYKFPSFDEAFKGDSCLAFGENVNNEWKNWQLSMFTLPGTPGDGILPGSQRFVRMWFGFIGKQLTKWLSRSKSRPFERQRRMAAKNRWKLWRSTRQKLSRGSAFVFEKTFRLMSRLLMARITTPDQRPDRFTLRLLRRLRKTLLQFTKAPVYRNNTWRRTWVAVDLAFTVMEGMIKDKVIYRDSKGEIKLNFDAINNRDYTEWLAEHGAHPELTLQSPFVRSMYDGPFAFIKGHLDKPSLEAGTILRIFVRLALTCKKHVVWRMQGGMGDIVFSPLYEELTKRGVKFKFFHKVKNLELSPDKKQVARIRIGRQVTLVNGEYHPFIEVNGLPCWGSHPVYEYIIPDERQELVEKNIDLESSWSPWKDREEIVLEAGRDYDKIILGISLGGIPHTCGEIIEAYPAWKNMVNKVQTVQTQAFQFWFQKDSHALGLDPHLVLTAHADPVDTFAAMNQLLDKEKWQTAQQPQYIAYCCGVLDESEIPAEHDYAFPERERDRVKKHMLGYLQENMKSICPVIFKDNTREFDWDVLSDPQERRGISRVEAQYWRANINPSDRYVLSVKGSSAHRLRADETGIGNLLITGDWIQNGFNAGFVEGAVIAGILTARAVSGFPHRVIGEGWG